ncbi:response regulator [Fluoribacter dumoffii]|uniref:MHYT domain-containing protein n=1 Tax=Fluoribacter dumoffii TaxID=463 RepID=UPI002243050E|nr:MHYT domain-containing protein [Fluoribacter dumoffii]MCW8417466.1 response regulator [Fluoribacter dumoffii]MCW8454692.1 response regulator [Fluoribacter dumoffii]MCW8461230.1 response regulator [Fluoribacter dumoffii]MCW8484671.1 response regulator [Fluoribacter dumoffii]
MSTFSEWFQTTSIPAERVTGYYDLKLVILSYLIAVFASYVALNLVGRLRATKNKQDRIYWLAGGAFAMGAGIWSMHFVGMLAFIMPMPMEYEYSWTAASLFIAILASASALFILQKKDYSTLQFVLGGMIVGLAISLMHYMGMEGMKVHVTIHYLPGLFFLSIAIGIAAAEIAIWLALKSNQGSSKRQFNLKIISSLIMGFAICGMHYTGMSAAVFTPNLSHMMLGEKAAIQTNFLAFFIAGISGLIFAIALTASGYYKKMLTAIANEKKFLNAMLDNLEDGIIACNAEGKITVLNHTIQKYIDSDKSNKTIHNIGDFFKLFTLNNKPIKQGAFPLNRALDGERIRGVEFIMHAKSEVRNVVIDGQKIINSNGDNLGAVIVIHDITERKQTEKLKNEFVSIVSHELRTPLTSIRGSLGILLSEIMGKFPPKVKKFLEIANNNCERLLLLINDILDIEKIEAGKMDFELKVSDLNKIVHEAIENNRMYAQKFGVNIELINHNNEQYQVRVDAERLMQVLANLISNACKFSYEHEKVIVRIEQINSSVRVSITNKGDGISPEFQTRIFQKFSQGDASTTRGKGGTGLGLNISKTIMEKMNGLLSFESKPHDVTTFYFELPLAQQLPVIQEKNERRLQEAKKRLLICEDDSEQANYIKLLLESAGFIVETAQTANEARKLLANSEFHALLLDLILPDQDGVSFIRELRKNKKTKNLPIIVLSVIAETGKELSNGDAVSIVDWLDKPIDFNKLLFSINKIQKDNSKPHILHIEDNKDTQEIIRTLLEKYARVSTANNLNEAQEMLKKDKYNLIILDLFLPDGNGADILPLISKYHAPVLVFSDTKINEDCSKYVSQALLKSNSSNEILVNTIQNLL